MEQAQEIPPPTCYWGLNYESNYNIIIDSLEGDKKRSYNEKAVEEQLAKEISECSFVMSDWLKEVEKFTKRKTDENKLKKADIFEISSPENFSSKKDMVA